MYALQDQNWKLVFYSHGPDELYDLLRDPFELENAAEQQIEQKTKLQHELMRILKESLKPGAGTASSELDPKTIEDLKTLGYL